MNPGLTVVYYTANTEDEAFEARVRAQILEGASHLPIISVSQRPISFGRRVGRNVCVGQVGACDANAFRQLAIGAELAETEWIVVAEADTLYPPAYFAGVRDKDAPRCVRYAPVYILWDREPGREGFRLKEWSEGAQYVRRDYLLRRIQTVLSGRPEWSSPEDRKPGEVIPKRTWGYRCEPRAPVVSCKTGRGLRWQTGVIEGMHSERSLPYWGEADAVRDRFFQGRVVA